MQRTRRLWAVLLGVGILALMIQIAVRLPDLDRGLPRMPFAKAAPVASEKVKMVMAALPCFECHNFKRYESGTKFAHTDHDAVGHCHVCHTFQHHARIGIRKEKCVECHEASEGSGDGG